MISFTTLLSFWWVLPLVMMALCLAMMVFCLRRMRKGGSFREGMPCGMMCGMRGWRGMAPAEKDPHGEKK